VGFLRFRNFEPVQDDSLDNRLVEAIEKPALGRDTPTDNQMPVLPNFAGTAIEAFKVPAPKGTTQENETEQKSDTGGGCAQRFHHDCAGTL